MQVFVNRLILLLGFVLLGLSLSTLGSTATAQSTPAVPADQTVRQHIRRLAHEKPSSAIRKRLRRYEPYIQYVAGLSFTRPGVTVNADFVRALIAAESGARPDAVSSKGAIGLMQILPETGRRAARELHDSGHRFRHVRRERLRALKPDDLNDPAINILIGSYLLDRYNRRFGGNLARTISAWNAGPERVRQYRGTPPYRETLTLIGRVNAYYRYFLRLRRQ